VPTGDQLADRFTNKQSERKPQAPAYTLAVGGGQSAAARLTERPPIGYTPPDRCMLDGPQEEDFGARITPIRPSPRPRGPHKHPHGRAGRDLGGAHAGLTDLAETGGRYT
jgi:hypothetical protein